VPSKEKPSQSLQPLKSARIEPESASKEPVVAELPKPPAAVRILSYEAMQSEKTEPLPISPATALPTASDSRQRRIETLETELAKIIGQLSALKQRADEDAAALIAHAGQLKQAVNEKEASQKLLEALKTSQKAAAQILFQRQNEIEALKEKLSEAQTQLEQTDAANALLTNEKMELTERLEEARLEAHWNKQEIQPEFESDEEAPEPYCDPTDDVISEDDVHIEQKLAADEIPSFNLAEQIMAAQRKASAARRKPPESSGKPAHNGSIEHVIGHYVSPANSAKSPVKAPQTPPPSVGRTERFLRWQGESLSPYQESLLSAIIQKDIQRFCTLGLPSLSMRPSGHRPTDN